MKKLWLFIVRHKAIFAVITMALYVAGAQSLYLHNGKTVTVEATLNTVSSTFTYDCPNPSSEDIVCLEKRYQTLTVEKGVKGAYDALKSQYQTDPKVQADCHQLSHVIGRTEADMVQNIDQAYSQGDNFCWSGYYHGVMESLVKRIGYKNLPAKLPTICASIKAQKPYSFYHYNCVHGLGHGVMDVTYGDISKSLKWCDLLLDPWEQQSCYGGVFMQNVMDEIDPGHGQPHFKANDPMYPCDAVGDKYREQCYLMQTSHALHSQDEDFSKVFAECAAVETKYRDTCYQSLGRDASGNSDSTVGQARASCMLGTTLDARQNCIIGAVKDFVSYYHSEKQATQLCLSLDSSLQLICQSTETEYYATF